MATKISYTTETYTPMTGCTHSGTPECDGCYARRGSGRLKGMGMASYENGFSPAFHKEVLEQMFNKLSRKRKPIMVFLVSMGDIFHQDHPFEEIDMVMDVVRKLPEITFQVLTKRAQRMAEYFSTRRVPSNVWLGVTCGHSASLFRVDYLRNIPAPVRWISVEPLLEDIANEGLDLTGIDWVVVGGESGPGARRMMESWAVNMRDLAERSGTVFYFKQWGRIGQDGVRRSREANGCLLQGKEYHNYPTPRTDY